MTEALARPVLPPQLGHVLVSRRPPRPHARGWCLGSSTRHAAARRLLSRDTLRERPASCKGKTSRPFHTTEFLFLSSLGLGARWEKGEFAAFTSSSKCEGLPALSKDSQLVGWDTARGFFFFFFLACFHSSSCLGFTAFSK